MPASHPSAITMEDARKSLVSDEAMDRCDATPSKINVSNISFNDVWSVEGSLESKAAESNILINQDESGHEDKDDVQSNGSVTEMQHSDNSIEVLETADVPTDIDTQHNDKSESDNSRVEPLQNSEIPCDNKNISSVVENQNNGENNENAEEMDLSETATTNCKMLNNNTNHSEQTEDIDATVNLPVKRKLEDSDVTQQETMPKKAQVTSVHLCTDRHYV